MGGKNMEKKIGTDKRPKVIMTFGVPENGISYNKVGDKFYVQVDFEDMKKLVKDFEKIKAEG